MAAKYEFSVRGIGVKVWETSFKVEGMSKTVFVGHHMTKDMVKQMVEAIYDNVFEVACEKAKDQVSERFESFVRDDILGGSNHVQR